MRTDVTASPGLNEWKSHEEGCPRGIEAILGNRGAAVKFGDEAHDVKPQTEMRPVVLALSVLEQRFEQPGQHDGRNRRPVIDDGEFVAGARARETDQDCPRRRTEVHGVLDELVQQLKYEIGSTVHETLVRRRLHVEARPEKSVAVARNRRLHQVLEVESHTLGLLDAFLHPRCGA